MNIANKDRKALTILMAEDDPDDRLMAKEAFEEIFLHNIHFVENGEELMCYLNRIGKYKNTEAYPFPSLILLDLNMPKKDGREALKEIKAHPVFRRIPVIVLTTSKAEEDIIKTYDLGVNSFITKPMTFLGLVETAKTLGKYWFEIADLPPHGE